MLDQKPHLHDEDVGRYPTGWRRKPEKATVNITRCPATIHVVLVFQGFRKTLDSSKVVASGQCGHCAECNSATRIFLVWRNRAVDRVSNASRTRALSLLLLLLMGLSVYLRIRFGSWTTSEIPCPSKPESRLLLNDIWIIVIIHIQIRFLILIWCSFIFYSYL